LNLRAIGTSMSSMHSFSRPSAAVLCIAVVALGFATGCGSSASTKAVPSTSRRAAPSPTRVSLPDLIARVRSGIVRIESTLCNETVLGTGFLVDAHDVATVDHVVDGATSITLSQNGQAVGTGAVIGADASRDIALASSSSSASWSSTPSPQS